MFYHPDSKCNLIISRMPWQHQILYESKTVFLEGLKRARPLFQIIQKQTVKLSNTNEIKLNFQIKFKSSSIKIPQLNKPQQIFFLSNNSNQIVASQSKIIDESNKDQNGVLCPNQNKFANVFKDKQKSQVLQNLKRTQTEESIPSKDFQKNNSYSLDFQRIDKNYQQQAVISPSHHAKLNQKVQQKSVNLTTLKKMQPKKQNVSKKGKKNNLHQSNQCKKIKNKQKKTVDKVDSITKNKKEMKLDKFIQNLKLDKLFICKSQKKLKYTIKSFFKSILTIDIELTFQPIMFLGFYKNKVKSFKIMKEYKQIVDGIIKFQPIKEKSNKYLGKNLKLTNNQSQFYEVDSQEQIILKVSQKETNIFATIVLQLQQNKNGEELIILD